MNPIKRDVYRSGVILSASLGLFLAVPSTAMALKAFDMVGNVIEFVADWAALATTGTNWDVFIPGFGGDISNVGGVPSGPIYGLPGTTLRGGSFAIVPNSGGTGQGAGVYAIDQNGAPNSIGDGTAAGFRCGANLQVKQP